MVYLSPPIKQRFFDNDGNPLANGKVHFYAAGSAGATLQDTYSNAAGAVNTNPVSLDARGEAAIWFGDLPYLVVLKDSAGNTIWTEDNVSRDGVGLPSVNTDIEFLIDDYLEHSDDDSSVVLANNIGLQSLKADLEATGGGSIVFSPKKTYYIGGPINQPRTAQVVNTYYNRAPTYQYLLDLDGVNVRVVGNGAVLKNAPGGFYGVFEDNDTATTTSNNSTTNSTYTPGVPPGQYYNGIAGGNQGYLGDGACTPYYGMVRITGADFVQIENLELHGNLDETNVGGPFSDTGIQLAMTGLSIYNAQRVYLRNVTSQYHGQDGIHIDGEADALNDSSEQGLLENCTFEFNGRSAMSFVGGRGWVFDNCKFNWTGFVDRSNTNGPVQTSNGSGVDFEAEGLKRNEEILMRNCEFIGNVRHGIVADSGTKTRRIRIESSIILGCQATNPNHNAYSLWITRPGFEFDRCIIGGTAYLPYSGYPLGTDDFDPSAATEFTSCLITDDVSFSPTGTLFNVNNLLIEGGLAYLTFDDCTFVYTTAAIGGFGNYDGPICTDCTFIAKAGTFRPYNRTRGTQSHYIAQGGTIGVPNLLNAVPGVTDIGHAEVMWQYSQYVEITALGTGTGGIGTYTLATAFDLESQQFAIVDSNYDAGATITGSVNGTTLDVTVTNISNISVGDKLLVTRRFAATVDNKTSQALGFTTWGDVAATLLPKTSRQYHLWSTALTADRTVTLSTQNARQGQFFHVTRTAGGAFNLNVAGATTKALATNTWCMFVFNGTSWILMAYGAL